MYLGGETFLGKLISCKEEDKIILETQAIFNWFWQFYMINPVYFLCFQGSQAWKAFSYGMFLECSSLW